MPADAIRIEMLPARMGDCILVECLRRRGHPWRLLVDGGPPDTWPLLQEARCSRLAADGQPVDVAVVTHIDSDHIGGMVPAARRGSRSPGLMVRDVWFNGAPQLPAVVRERRPQRHARARRSAPRSVGSEGQRALPWNSAFDDAAIDVGDPGGSCA